jgi:hypothetical protein
VVHCSVFPESPDFIDDWNTPTPTHPQSGYGIQDRGVSVQNIRLDYFSYLIQPVSQAIDDGGLVQDGQFGRETDRRWSAIKMPSIGILFKHSAISLLRPCQMEGFPPQRTLFLENRQSTKSIATMQWKGMIEDMKNSH